MIQQQEFKDTLQNQHKISTKKPVISKGTVFGLLTKRVDY